MFSILENIFGKIKIIGTLYKKVWNQNIQTTNINNPIFIVGEKYDKNILQKINSGHLKKFGVSLQGIPEGNLTPLEPYNTSVAIQKLYYVTEENIAKMFIELLTKSADLRYSDKVHRTIREYCHHWIQMMRNYLNLCLRGNTL